MVRRVWIALVIAAACTSGDDDPSPVVAPMPPSPHPIELGDATDDGTPSSDKDASDEASTPTTYNDIADPSRWESFDLSQVNGAVTEHEGSAFDGRYIYFPPSGSNRVARYDTKAAFGMVSAWSTIDLGSLKPGVDRFVGAVFDGRYVILVPFATGIVARFDSKASSFVDPAAWSFVDLSTFVANAKGYFGGAFDGRYVYLSPFRGGLVHGLAARFDTQGPLDASTSWTFFDLTTVDPALIGLSGISFDKRYLYYAPYNQNTGRLVARFDTQMPFASSTSWTKFDVGTVDPGCIAFEGTLYDGRYIYLIPWRNGTSSVVCRLDTTAPFALASSWSAFDLAKVDANAKGFVGSQFDGRFVYLVPFGVGNNGLVLRYDTTSGTLDNLAAWSKFDLTTKNPLARGYAGAGFDGRFIYLVPEATPTPVRFDAKTPPSFPPFTASFL